MKIKILVKIISCDSKCKYLIVQHAIQIKNEIMINDKPSVKGTVRVKTITVAT